MKNISRYQILTCKDIFLSDIMSEFFVLLLIVGVTDINIQRRKSLDTHVKQVRIHGYFSTSSIDPPEKSFSSNDWVLGISKNIFWNTSLQSCLIGRTALVFYRLKGQHFFFKILIYYISFLIGGVDWLLRDIQLVSGFTTVQCFCQLRSSK